MKTKLFLVTCTLCYVSLVFADYAPRDSFMINQPDGTFLWVYECGDEY